MSSALVHHTSAPHTITGGAIFITRWWMLHCEMPCSLLIIMIIPATASVWVHALAVWCQMDARWSIRTASNLISFEGGTDLLDKGMLWSGVLGSSLLVVRMTCISSICQERV